MLQYESNHLLNDLSWEKVGQDIVDSIGQLLDIDIAILHLNKLGHNSEQYCFYQKLNSKVARLNQDLLKLTVTPSVESSNGT